MGRTRTDAERCEAIEKLGYEIKMLSRTASALARKRRRRLSWVYHNSTIHSFLLAVRNLNEFFFDKKATKGAIIAADLVTAWSCAAPRFREGKHWRKTDPKKRIHGRTPFDALISQRLHHITWSRVDESKIDWIQSAILKEFRRPIEKFAAALPPEQRSKYFDRAVLLMQRTCTAI